MEDRIEINNANRATSIKNLAEFDKSQRPAFLDGVMKVEEEAWPEEWRATRDKFESRLEVFPEGFFVVDKGEEMAGVSTSQIVDYDSGNLPQTWDEVTGDGYIKKTHKPDGNALYVVSVGVSQRFQGQGIGHQLVESQKSLAKKLNFKTLFLGARIPGYHEYHRDHPEATADDYAKLEREPGKKLDPELKFYESCGLKTVKVIPNYGPDSESENYGVIMSWENPDIKRGG